MCERKSKSEITEQCRTARTAKLAGKSPHEIGIAKARQALDWVYRWGWASATTIDAISGVQRRGLAARLVRQHFLAQTRTESGGARKGVPANILTLTPSGVNEVERWREELLPYEIDPYRVRQELLRHNELTQWATCQSLLKKAIGGYQTEKEAAAASVPGRKQPDVIWLLPDGQRVAVEVELTSKWDRVFDQFILACIDSLTRHDGRARFDRLAFITDSPAILKRYKAAFSPGAQFGRWQKDQYGRWQQAGSCEVPAWMGGKVIWRLL